MPDDPFAGSILAGFGRLLFVHAHPDDETIATGALIAALVDSGRRCFVLTATRGERGEARPGALGPGADLVALRRAEWRRATERLGVERAVLLGTPPARAAGAGPRRYADSGMAWLDAAETLAGPAPDAPADALTAADPGAVAADIAACAAAIEADALITYDQLGGYGHPDHVALVGPTREAAAGLGLPVLHIVSPGRSAEPGAAWFDLAAARPATVAALECYASQLRVDGDDLVHVGGQRQPLPLRVGVRGPC